MATSNPANYLAQVQTYNKSGLATLENQNCFIDSANMMFNEFNKIEKNLGSTVTFDRPSRYRAKDGLTVDFQPTTDLVETLTVDKALTVGFNFTSQQMIFNAEQFMEKYGRAAIAELGAVIEADVATLCETAPYRFAGDGVTQITNVTQLAQFMANFRTFGAARGEAKGYLYDLAEPQISGSALNQFVVDRNERIAKSWLVGDFANTRWMKSNLLPLHVSGTTGQQGQTLTVVSTNDPTGRNITQITCSGANLNDADAIKANDSFQFKLNVGSLPNIYFLTYTGHVISGARCQIKSTVDAESNGSGNVTFNIYPALCAQPGNANQNIMFNIVAGMQLQTYPNHRCGLITAGNPLFVAMPGLPDMYPYPTSTEVDPTTGAALRLYYGGIPDSGEIGMVYGSIWGKSCVSDYTMKIMFPENQ